MSVVYSDHKQSTLCWLEFVGERRVGFSRYMLSGKNIVGDISFFYVFSATECTLLIVEAVVLIYKVETTSRVGR